MIPFRISPLVESVLPLKLYEFLAAGLPVVASRWNVLVRLNAPMELADSEEEFIDALRRAPGSPGIETRVDFARANAWQQRFAEMEQAIFK